MSETRVVQLVPSLEGSALALDELQMQPGAAASIGDPKRDNLLHVYAGRGTLSVAGDVRSLEAGSAGLVLAGEEARLEAGDPGLSALLSTVDEGADRHAPLGARALVVGPDGAGSERATGSRSFRILLGPHNGSTRATLFAGFVPPGKAPWHYHLYDEIVWVPEGPGRLHAGDTIEELGPGAAFRLRPRQVHVVENTSPARDMTVIGVFTPAGSPSAAYLPADLAAEYRYAG